jgi:excisionase family DNA binding protein
MGNKVLRDGPYLSASGAADLLHVSPKTVARWAKEGKLPFTKTLGGHRRFSREQIEGLVASMRVEVRQP